LFGASHLGRFKLVPNKHPFIPEPKYTLKHWEDEKFQGRQFLNGVNPVMIRVAEKAQ